MGVKGLREKEIEVKNSNFVYDLILIKKFMQINTYILLALYLHWVNQTTRQTTRQTQGKQQNFIRGLFICLSKDKSKKFT